MVAIVNITPNPKPTGLHTYSIRINNKEIAQFAHFREHPLSTLCLKAAIAVDNALLEEGMQNVHLY